MNSHVSATIILLLCAFALSCATPIHAQTTPASAYLAMQDAIRKGNLDEVAKYMTKVKQEELAAMRKKPDCSEEKVVKLLQTLPPSQLKIDDQKYKGEKAVLTLTGMAANWFKPDLIEKNYGRALFVKEGGAWKLSQESWNNKPFDTWPAEDRAPFDL